MAQKRATVMGLGRHGGGVAVSRYLAINGYNVTVTDLASAEELADSVGQLSDVPIGSFAFGGHRESDFQDADLVVINPAVKPNHPLVLLAGQNGAEITSEIELFLNRCTAKVIGITGTTGKSTTATMLYEILQADSRRTWLGGNIGTSLLGILPEIAADDLVVLELSSFQLAHLNSQVRWPQIAVITNCSANHLDWHGTYTEYVHAKQRLIHEQGLGDVGVLNGNDPESSKWRNLGQGIVLPCINADSIVPLAIPGEHNRQNARLAATVAIYLGVPLTTINNALVSFQGLPHRLQFVGEILGRRFINDSKATSSAATIAALATIQGRTWLLAGGADLDGDFRPLCSAIAQSATGAILFGAARNRLVKTLNDQSPHFPVHSTENLQSAVVAALKKSRPGDTILLSPGCPSFDQFRDFADRGRAFMEIIEQLAG